MYDVIETFDLGRKVTLVKKAVDGVVSFIPVDAGNLDYQRYLEWVASNGSESPDSDGQTSV
jgi:hypothetical protein